MGSGLRKKLSEIEEYYSQKKREIEQETKKAFLKMSAEACNHDKKITKVFLESYGFKNEGIHVTNTLEYFERYSMGEFEIHFVRSKYGGVEENHICYQFSNDPHGAERIEVFEPEKVSTLFLAYRLATGKYLKKA